MGKFELMALPYEADALEPVISRDTISFHHGKHLAAYVNNLNALLPGSGFEEASLKEIVCKASGGILNNAGQILNHELYFGQFKTPSNSPSMGSTKESLAREGEVGRGALADAIKRLRLVRGFQGRVPEERCDALWQWLGLAFSR